jgi:outer membrane protein TolC
LRPGRRLLITALIIAQLGCPGLPIAPWSAGGDASQAQAAPFDSPPPPTGLNSVFDATAPRTLRHNSEGKIWDMTLEEAIQLALSHSKVMADSGGRVLQAPVAVATVYDPALRESDPLTGPMAALSAFDATLASTSLWSQGSNLRNDIVVGGGTYFLDSEQFINDTAITKRAATGALLRLDSNTEYFGSNAPLNLLNSVATTAVGGEIVQPLLRGAGVEFNRVAGTYAIPGGFNGVVIGRINTDISLLDFESAVRGVLIDVERAYWDLALSYRDLDAKIAARNATLETWRLVHRKLQIGMAGADEEAEARAREQYYLLQAQVENAYSGAPPVSAALGSTVGNAVIGNSAGVLGNERRLRQLLGLPPTDDRLIRPITEPAHASVSFDWQSSVYEAMNRRVELRRQMLVIRRREAELSATRNLRLPRLDAVAGVNYRTFSNEYTQFTTTTPPLIPSNFNSVNYNVGMNFSMPLGNRLAKTSIRNAELQLARERAILHEQRLHVSHELTSSVVELDRAFTLMNTNFNRRAAAEQQTAALMRKFEAGAAGLELVLDSQRRLADAEAAYHRAVFDYNRAIADVHLSRGTLLDYDGVKLADALCGDYEASRFYWDYAQREPTIDYRMANAAAAPTPAAPPMPTAAPAFAAPPEVVQTPPWARANATAVVPTPTPVPQAPGLIALPSVTSGDDATPVVRLPPISSDADVEPAAPPSLFAAPPQ